MLLATNLSKKFIIKEKRGLFKKGPVKEITAVQDVSLKIEPGKIVGLLGVNGAGKTTTIKMLSAILQPTSGTLEIDNINPITEPNKVKSIINLITGGERNIYWRLTARENLEYFGSLYGVPRNKLDTRIESLLKMVGLDDVENLPVERYSKGMKQRLQIARGLINNPQYVFLDEPTLGLDISIAKEIRSYIKKLATIEKKGILLTTHYIAEADELCDYIYIINKGRIILEGTTNELKGLLKTDINLSITVNKLTNNIKRNLELLLQDGNTTINYKNEDSSPIIEIASKENHTSEIIKFLSSCDILVLEMKLMEPSLEDVLMTSILGGDTFEKDNTCDIC